MGALLRHPNVGRRGLALLFFAGLDLIYAFSLAMPDQATRRTPLFVWFTSVAPLWVWASVWGFTGVVCLFYAFRRRDTWGFTAAITLKVLWGLLCAGAWALGGVERAYVSGAIWLAAAGFVWVISSWPEVNDGGEQTWTTPPSS